MPKTTQGTGHLLFLKGISSEFRSIFREGYVKRSGTYGMSNPANSVSMKRRGFQTEKSEAPNPRTTLPTCRPAITAYLPLILASPFWVIIMG